VGDIAEPAEWWDGTPFEHNPDGVRIRVGSSHRTLSTTSTR
jgi:hypothetical protein